VDNLRSLFANLLKQSKVFWGKLSLTKRLIIGAAIVLGIVAVGTVISVSKEDPYQYLFVDLSPEDTSAIAGYLRANNITDFVIDKKGIKVAPDKVIKLRVDLAQEGLPAKGVVGWEKFDEENFTRTDFEQNIQKQRAIQGELARTISSIEGIVSARVHIVQPKNSLFVKDQKPSSAAIYLKTKRGVELDQRQIRGIQHLVSRSVEGLDLNQVTILDSSGALLTQVEPTDFSSKMTKEILEYKNKVEDKLEERIRGIVGRIVGPDRVDARVDAEVDFTQEKQTISDVNPDDAAIISKNTTGFSMDGTGLNPTGIPGSKSNVPGEQENLQVSTNKTGSKRDSEIVNFDVSKVLSEKTLPVGNIKRLSISVLVDGKQTYPVDGTIPEFVPRTTEEMAKIADLVKGAVGFKDGRDVVTVENMLFQLDPFQMLEISTKRKEDREYVSTLAVAAATGLALVLFFAFVVRPYFRWLSYDPQKKVEKTLAEEFKPDLELSGIQNIKIQEDIPFEKLSPQEQVVYLAKHEPKRTTEAIRIMLNPHGAAGGGA
jgi:flagellar M-ring protein FliF